MIDGRTPTSWHSGEVVASLFNLPVPTFSPTT